jgi:hypothetical protein
MLCNPAKVLTRMEELTFISITQRHQIDKQVFLVRYFEQPACTQIALFGRITSRIKTSEHDVLDLWPTDKTDKASQSNRESQNRDLRSSLY